MLKYVLFASFPYFDIAFTLLCIPTKSDIYLFRARANRREPPINEGEMVRQEANKTDETRKRSNQNRLTRYTSHKSLCDEHEISE